jgi:mannose-1-phosphate guanylyltransferase
VADGTSIPLVDVAALLEHHRATGAALTVAAYEPAGSRVALQGLKPVGVYVFDRQIVDLVPITSFQDIKENLVPRLYREGHRVEAFPVPEMSPRVMDAGSYLAANLWMVSRLAGTGPTTDRSGLMAHATAWVDPDALIVGPVMLGAGVRVQAGATIIGPACVGAGSVIEPGAVLARSLTWEDCIVRERAIVDRSFLAAGVEIAPEAAVMNAIRATTPESGSGRFGFFDQRRSQPRASNPVIKPALS